MFDAFRPGGTLAWDYLWQSSLFLAIGLAATVFAARRPARAHRLLLLAMLGALVTPILAQAARRAGWGLLASGGPQESIGISSAAPEGAAGPLAGGSPPVMRRIGPTGFDVTDSVRLFGPINTERQNAGL